MTIAQGKEGKFADFHALQHTFITNLARAGVAPKVAMDLARHSDINLTMSRYSHTVLEGRAEALRKLPDLFPKRRRRGGVEIWKRTAIQKLPLEHVLVNQIPQKTWRKSWRQIWGKRVP